MKYKKSIIILGVFFIMLFGFPFKTNIENKEELITKLPNTFFKKYLIKSGVYKFNIFLMGTGRFSFKIIGQEKVIFEKENIDRPLIDIHKGNPFLLMIQIFLNKITFENITFKGISKEELKKETSTIRLKFVNCQFE